MSCYLHIVYQLKRIGYNVNIQNLNASWYGSYTKRIRTIVAAVRSDLNQGFDFPEISYLSKKEKKQSVFKYSKKFLLGFVYRLETSLSESKSFKLRLITCVEKVDLPDPIPPVIPILIVIKFFFPDC